MDIADRSAYLQEVLNRNALKTQQAKNLVVPSVYCVDCEELISKARRKASPNACRCVDCQSDYEKRLKTRGF